VSALPENPIEVTPDPPSTRWTCQRGRRLRLIYHVAFATRRGEFRHATVVRPDTVTDPADIQEMARVIRVNQRLDATPAIISWSLLRTDEAR
jgi:hypothetical protein